MEPFYVFQGDDGLFAGQQCEAFAKHESCGSLHSSMTDATDYTAMSLSDPSEDLNGPRSNSLVSFDVDEFNIVKSEVFEYPAVEEEDKASLFWSQEDVEERRQERNAMIANNSEDRARFIAYVEELFDVPMRKRLSKRMTRSETEGIRFVSPTTEEQAMLCLSSSDYRGYEHRCVRSIIQLRKRIIRQTITAYWVRGGEEFHDLTAKMSHRQSRFARMVAISDARVAAQYLDRVAESQS